MITISPIFSYLGNHRRHLFAASNAHSNRIIISIRSRRSVIIFWLKRRKRMRQSIYTNSLSRVQCMSVWGCPDGLTDWPCDIAGWRGLSGRLNINQRGAVNRITTHIFICLRRRSLARWRPVVTKAGSSFSEALNRSIYTTQLHRLR